MRTYGYIYTDNVWQFWKAHNIDITFRHYEKGAAVTALSIDFLDAVE